MEGGQCCVSAYKLSVLSDSNEALTDTRSLFSTASTSYPVAVSSGVTDTEIAPNNPDVRPEQF